MLHNGRSHAGKRSVWAVRAALLASVALIAGCGGSGSADADGAPGSSTEGSEVSGPLIVVTYPVLGSLVEELVGDQADVEVLMPNGVDPHDWQPSAKDAEAIGEADLVVANGLGLEETLEDTLAEAEAGGVPVFLATDHVHVRTIGDGEVPPGEHDEDEHAQDDDEHANGEGAEDPHIWTDPIAMRAVVAALADVIEQQLGLPLADRATELESRLDALDTELEDLLASVPAAERKLVTSHESMGDFADRYGFELVGALVPSLGSQAEASAAELAEVKEQIEEEDVAAIFTEVGASSGVAESIADEVGVELVELPSHNLPEDGSYFTFMRELARRIACALGS